MRDEQPAANPLRASAAFSGLAHASLREALEITEQLATALPNHVDYKDLPGVLNQRLQALAEAETLAIAGTGRDHPVARMKR